MFGSYSVQPFGVTPDGTAIEKICLSAPSGMTLEVITLGATMHRLLVPASKGNAIDIVLGKDTLAGYVDNGLCNASIIGRCANRISNAGFQMDGVAVRLEANCGAHSIHGGGGCYARRVFAPVIRRGESDLCLELKLLDYGDGGFPGHLFFSIQYILSEHSLRLEYNAVATRPTPWNVTSHAYFDLNGNGSGARKEHVLQIFADCYLPVAPDGIPTGEIRPVDGTAFDFRNPRLLQRALDGQDAQIRQFDGFDHNFCINGSGLRRAAVLEGLESGVKMEVITDRPGMQLFTLNQVGRPVCGKGGKYYHRHDGICLETQHYPDAVNQAPFPSPIINAGAAHTSVTEFVFSSPSF